MQKYLKGIALAGLTGIVTVTGLAAMSSDADAHGRHRHRHGVTIIIGHDGHHGGGCRWLWHKWQNTGSPKWYNRWHHCKYGW